MAVKLSQSKSMSHSLPEVDHFVPPTELHVNLEKFPAFSKKEVGEVCEGSFKAKVISMTKDEHMQTMRLELTKLESYAEDEDGDET